jgi:vancomycin permeability regulator SanA
VAIALYGLTASPTRADVAVVLGNKVRRDGTPSPRLRARLEEGLALFEAGKARHLLVSGGCGKEGFSEAHVMRRWLVARGVPPENVIVDPRGYNTWLTAKNAGEIMERRDLSDATIVSQYFHLARCHFLFRRAGVDVAGLSAPQFYEIRDLYSLPREFIALCAYASGLKGAK